MFTIENTTGYTAQECEELNEEFAAIVAAKGLEADTEEYAEAESAFNDEVAKR